MREFLQREHPGLKLICYCDEAVGKIDIKEALAAGLNEMEAGARKPGGAVTVLQGGAPSLALKGSDRAMESPRKPSITILIGPEGDFSRAEVALALERGWQPVSLGDSRLRIETAAIVATAAVYLHFSR